MVKFRNKIAGVLMVFSAPIAATASVGFAAAPMIQYVPKNAMLYVGVAGQLQQWAGYQGSHMQMLVSQSPRLQKLLKKIATPPAGEAAAEGPPFEYPLAIYLTNFRGANHKSPDGNLGMVIDAGNHWKQVLTAIASGNKRVPGEYRGHVGGLVYDIYQATPVELKLLKGRNGDMSDTLAANPQFKAFTAGLGAMSANSWWINMPKFSSELLNAHYTDDHVAELMPLIKKVFKGAGLDNYTLIAGGGGFVGKDYVYHMKAGMRQSGHNDTAGLKQMLELVPEDAQSVATYHFDLAAIYKTIVSIGKQAGFSTNIQQAMTQAGTLAGISLRRDVIDALGARWVEFSIPNRSGSYSFVSESILRHPHKVASSLQAAAPLVLMGINARRQQENPNAKPISLTATSIGKDTIYSIQGSGFAWCIIGQRLIVSASPSVIKSVLMHPINKTIMDNPVFAAAYRKLSADHGLRDIAWVNSRKLITGSYLWLIKEVRKMDTLKPNIDKILRPSDMPNLSLLQKYSRFSHSAQWYTPHNWELVIHSSLPGGDILTPQTGALMTQLSNPLVGKLLAVVATIGVSYDMAKQHATGAPNPPTHASAGAE